MIFTELDATSIDATVILPAYNEEEGLPLSLKALEDVLAGEDSSYEIMVVDDGSSDGTADVAGRYPCHAGCHGREGFPSWVQVRLSSIGRLLRPGSARSRKDKK
ncbi:MAG TPA: glycosyltransferase [Nitrospirae bacterium]|nr:glycosyltransferase [Nitrospirota bacterium]